MADGAPKNGRSTTADEENNCGSRGKEGGPSLNSLALVRKAIPRTYISFDNIEEWRRAVYKGVLLENNTQKFWVDEKLHKNCFLVLPKACDIAGGDEENCWSWITKEEKCFPMAVDIRVPKSKELSWLLIQGRFETRALSPKTTYEVAFQVKLNRTNLSMTGKIVLPDGTDYDCRTAGLQEVKKWIYVRAGKFMMGPKTVGTIHFILEETLDFKEGDLILGGVLIHPMD